MITPDQDTGVALEALRADDTYYPPRKPRPVLRPKWRTEYPQDFPVETRPLEGGPDAAA